MRKTIKERQAKFRKQKNALGLKEKRMYLTDDEYKQVKGFIEQIRINSQNL